MSTSYKVLVNAEAEDNKEQQTTDVNDNGVAKKEGLSIEKPEVS